MHCQPPPHRIWYRSPSRALFEGARSGLFNLLALGGGLLIIFLSVTRTFFVSLAAILFAIGLILLRPPQWLKRRLRRRIFWNLLLIAVVLAVLIAVVVVAFPSVLEHWSARSADLGTQDPTALTRIAEAAGKIEAVNADLVICCWARFGDPITVFD